MKFNEAGLGITHKHPETINGNVKNLSKMMKMKDKGDCHFYFKNLILPLITGLGEMVKIFGHLKCLLVVDDGIFCHLRDPRPSWSLGRAHKPKKSSSKGLLYRTKRLGNVTNNTIQHFHIGKRRTIQRFHIEKRRTV
jgi:hypothetical protein